jgi:hypothetical protein
LLSLSATSGEAIDSWLEWLHTEVAAQRERVKQNETLRPAIQPDGMRLHTVGPAAHGPRQQAHHHDHPHGGQAILPGNGGT